MPTLVEKGPPLLRGGRLDEAATPSDMAELLYAGVRRAMAFATPVIRLGASNLTGGLESAPPSATPPLLSRSTTENLSALDGGTPPGVPEEMPALDAVEDLRRWLNLTYEEVAEIAALPGPQTLYYWKRRAGAGRLTRPRESTVRQLFRVHAVLRAVAATFATPDDGRTLRAWAYERPRNGLTIRDLLLSGRIEEVEAVARPLIFGVGRHRASDPRYAAASIYDPTSDPEVPPQLPLPTLTDFDPPNEVGSEFE